MITITGKTNLVGLLGQPVSHSLSPIMHNAAYEEMGLDWCYVAIPCDKINLTRVTAALRVINCKGLNVTIPHKQEVLKACNKLTAIASNIKAVNTLIPEKNNQWIGANTDVDGFIMPLKDKNLINKNVIVIGCGGSARAVVMGLNSLKVKKITVFGRNETSLDAFIKNMKNLLSKSNILIEGINNKKLNITPYIEEADLIVNTTPVGMSGEANLENSLPFGENFWQSLNSKTIVYDLIYNPAPTKLLKFCDKKGCMTIDGKEMLIAQGAQSLLFWTNGLVAPYEVMHEALRNVFNKNSKDLKN